MLSSTAEGSGDQSVRHRCGPLQRAGRSCRGMQWERPHPVGRRDGTDLLSERHLQRRAHVPQQRLRGCSQRRWLQQRDRVSAWGATRSIAWPPMAWCARTQEAGPALRRRTTRSRSFAVSDLGDGAAPRPRSPRPPYPLLALVPDHVGRRRGRHGASEPRVEPLELGARRDAGAHVLRHVEPACREHPEHRVSPTLGTALGLALRHVAPRATAPRRPRRGPPEPPAARAPAARGPIRGAPSRWASPPNRRPTRRRSRPSVRRRIVASPAGWSDTPAMTSACPGRARAAPPRRAPLWVSCCLRPRGAGRGPRGIRSGRPP